MATVTPDDVVLTTWRTGASTITLTQLGFTDAKLVFQPNGNAFLDSPQIRAQAAVTLRGTPGERVDFFRFGFIQLKFVTDDWADYRGRTPADGSVFFAADRPPARPKQVCRDTYSVGVGGFPIVGPVIFYDADMQISTLVPFGGNVAGFLPAGTTIPASGSISLTFDFFDNPSRNFDLVRLNNSAVFIPPRLNFLHSLQTGAAFATMFAVQKGLGAPIEVMRTFQWNVRWRAHFGLDIVGRVVHLPPKSGDVMDMTVSHVVPGGPTDVRFRNSVTDSTLPVCNAVAIAAFTNPVLSTSTKWENWHVGH